MTEAYSLMAEQSVVGAAIIDAEHVVPEIIDIVQPQDFYIPMYGEFYRYVMEMTAYGKKIDYVTMAEVMKGKIDGNVSDELLKCADMVPSVVNAKAYADIVAKNARARGIQSALADATYSPLTSENVDFVTEKLMATLYDQSQCVKKGGLQSIRHGMSDWYTSIFKARPDRVDTGFYDLDMVLRGMLAGNLILLAARPAVGKTAFGVQIARHVAGTGKAVNIYSCEMEKGEILERLAANESNVNMDDIIDNDSLKDKQNLVDAIAQASDRLMKLPINISDDASITVAQIRAQCRMTKNLGLIVVDYIQLLKSSHRSESRNVEVGEISRSLKILANDLKVPVLALSQLSRDIEKRVGANKEPQMSDLRDSGSLEQDANKILFMYPVQDDVDHKIIAVKVAKNRRGHVGEVQFSFDGSHMRHNPLIRDDYAKPHGSNRAENPFAGR